MEVNQIQELATGRGLILFLMGLILFLNGIYLYFNPPANPTILAELQPNIWWGAIMTVAGVIFTLANRKKRID